MQLRDLLSGFAVAAAALLFGACGGNVVVDKGGTGGTGGTATTGGTGGTTSTCGPGLTQCAGAGCVNTATDASHCGSCNNPCGAGYPCLNGVCAGGVGGDGAGPPGCPPGYSYCSGNCYDLTSDAQHCGSCNTVCGPGAACMGSMCTNVEPSCVHCAELITPDGNPGNQPPCQGVSSDLYNQLITCTCLKKCAFQCSDNVCAKKPITQKCQDCLLDKNAGCGMQFDDCVNDP